MSEPFPGMVINHLGREGQVYGPGRCWGYLDRSGAVSEIVVGSRSCDRVLGLYKRGEAFIRLSVVGMI